jgi:hypothetical protein
LETASVTGDTNHGTVLPGLRVISSPVAQLSTSTASANTALDEQKSQFPI